MSTTREQFKTALARDLGDPGLDTFTDAYLNDFVDAATVEVGYWAPRKFSEDIDPVLNQTDYQVLASVFTDPEPTIEVKRVELWDNSQPLPVLYWYLTPQATNYLNTSAVGWEFIDGYLRLTPDQYNWIDLTNHVIRVNGYRPFPRVTDDATVLGFPFEVEMAARSYAKYAAYKQLDTDRTLFTQWQTRPNNSDITPAALMNLVTASEASWLRQAKRIVVRRTGS